MRKSIAIALFACVGAVSTLAFAHSVRDASPTVAASEVSGPNGPAAFEALPLASLSICTEARADLSTEARYERAEAGGPYPFMSLSSAAGLAANARKGRAEHC